MVDAANDPKRDHHVIPWEVGTLLKEAREQRKLSVVDAAARAGVPEAWWRKAERGTYTLKGELIDFPHRASLIQAARAVGLPPDRLLATAGYEDHRDSMIGEQDVLRKNAHDLLDRLDTDELQTVYGYLEGMLASRGFRR